MRLRHLFSFVLLFCTLSGPSGATESDTRRVAAWFEKHRHLETWLRQFVQRLPKGADLHSHLSGAVYGETYLRLAAENNLCVDTTSWSFTKAPCQGPTQVAAGKLTGSDYDAMVNRMSIRDLPFDGRSGHDQFFATFGVFGAVSGLADALPVMAAELSNRAAAENIHYLELMTTYQGKAIRQLGMGLAWEAEKDLSRRLTWLMEHGLAEIVSAARRDMDSFEVAYRKRLGCGTPQAQAGCGVPLRWLQQTNRAAGPEVVFAQLALAFALVEADPRVVGINLVAAEDNPVALRDYDLQMDMIAYLSRQMPGVAIALHAGELSLGLVPPEALHHHIRGAVETAGARRIGHGVALAYETRADTLLAEMRRRGVATEICLTSNEVILGVSGPAHPLPVYLKAGVPVVLASDDQGVSRIDLSNEYLRAARDYRLSYRQLKQLSRNSLSYSFLPGASLWLLDKQAEQARPVPACRQDQPGTARPSLECAIFLASSEKARQQWALEAAFTAFEQSPAWR